MFAKGSRYQNMDTYIATTSDGREVTAVRLPLPSGATPAGYYRMKVGQRLDHVAYAYLSDATAFWQLCDANGTVVPDSLAARDLVGIPPKA